MRALKTAMRYKNGASLGHTRSPLNNQVAILVMAAGFAAFFIPAEYAVGSTLHAYWKLVAMAVSVVCIVLYLIRCKITLRWVLLSLSIASYYLFSSFIMGSNFKLSTAVFHTIESCGFVTLLDYGFTRNPKRCLHAFIIAGMLMCSWHYLTFLQYRGNAHGMNVGLDAMYGMSRRQHFFLFTHDNGSVFYFLPVLSALWFRALQVTNKFRLPVTASVLTLYMYWSLWSVTAMLCMTFFVAVCVYVWKSDCTWPRSVVTHKQAIVAGVLFCCIVIAFYSSPLMGEISAYFKKANDLGRGRIWERAIPYIIQSPLFGVGYESDAVTLLKLRTNHCHNIIMQLLYTGGFITCILFMFGLNAYDLPAQKKDSQPLTKGQLILCAAIVAFFVAATFDWYLYMSPQFFIFILYHYTKEF